MHKNSSPAYLSRRGLVRALSLGALGLAACGTQSDSGSRRPSASLGVVDWVGYAPLFIARQKGFFQELGLDLNTRFFEANGQNMAAFAAGRLDALGDVLSGAIDLASKGKDFRVVLVADRSVGGDGILARNKVTSIEDFRGRRIALEEISVSHYFLLQVLAEANLRARDITLVNMTPGDAAAAYQSGSMDIAVTYEPFLSKANAARDDGRVLYDSSQMPYAIADIYEFDTQFIEANPEAIQAFVSGILQGLAYMKRHPEESAGIVARQLKLAPQEVNKFLQGVQLADLQMNLDMLTNPQSQGYLPKTMTALSRFLKEEGQIASVPDISRMVEPRFVLAARADT